MSRCLFGRGRLDRCAAHTLLLASTLGQWEVAQCEAGAQSYQAIGEPKLDSLPSVDDLVERPARGSCLLSEGLALIDWQAKVVVFEAFHASRIPLGIVLVNTQRSYTYGYIPGRIA